MAAEDLSLRVASPQDWGDVVAILVSAFYDDPTWSWAFPNPSLRAEQHRRLWGLFVDGAMRYPWVWLTPGNTATSVWIPPNGTDLSEEQEAALEPTIVEMLGADASPVIHAVELFDRAHPREVPHFYLSLLGTSAAHRGRGYGLALLAENLRRIDEAGCLHIWRPATRRTSHCTNERVSRCVVRSSCLETDPRFSGYGETLRPSDEPVTTVANHGCHRPGTHLPHTTRASQLGHPLPDIRWLQHSVLDDLLTLEQVLGSARHAR